MSPVAEKCVRPERGNERRFIRSKFRELQGRHAAPVQRIARVNLAGCVRSRTFVRRAVYYDWPGSKWQRMAMQTWDTALSQSLPE
jgi:hypothetical protein